jgi:hypothetical protein
MPGFRYSINMRNWEWEASQKQGTHEFRERDFLLFSGLLLKGALAPQEEGKDIHGAGMDNESFSSVVLMTWFTGNGMKNKGINITLCIIKAQHGC